jgi:hypothetical protein
MVFAKVSEILAVNKQLLQWFDGERFNLRKLNELEVRKQYQFEITNTFAAMEILINDEDINRFWENIKGNSKASAKESLILHALKQHTLRFAEEC